MATNANLASQRRAVFVALANRSFSFPEKSQSLGFWTGRVISADFGYFGAITEWERTEHSPASDTKETVLIFCAGSPEPGALARLRYAPTDCRSKEEMRFERSKKDSTAC
jgi:hypothetical protein